MCEENEPRLCRQRATEGMLRTVWSDGRRITKEYTVLRWPGDIRRPWLREHRCLVRLHRHGVPAPRSFGVDRVGRGVIRHQREFVSGAPVTQLDSGQREALAAHLAAVHAARVVMGDASMDNLLLTDEGGLLFIDYGRGRVFPLKGLLFYFHVGKELARCRRRILAGEPSAWPAFRARYGELAHYPSWAWRVVRLATDYWCRRWHLA